MMYHRFSNIITILVLFFLCLSSSAGQEVHTAPPAENTSEPEPVEPLIHQNYWHLWWFEIFGRFANRPYMMVATERLCNYPI